MYELRHTAGVLRNSVATILTAETIAEAEGVHPAFRVLGRGRDFLFAVAARRQIELVGLLGELQGARQCPFWP